jgi:hypothetical protein
MGPLEWDSEDELEPLVKHHMLRMVYFNQTLDKIESRIVQYSDCYRLDDTGVMFSFLQIIQKWFRSPPSLLYGGH